MGMFRAKLWDFLYGTSHLHDLNPPEQLRNLLKTEGVSHLHEVNKAAFTARDHQGRCHMSAGCRPQAAIALHRICK